MRTGCERNTGSGGDESSAWSELLDGDVLFDQDEVTGPVYWSELSADEAAREWPALRSWVDHLMVRFPHLDHHVIPRCWFLHNGHVEALAALRDYERVNYAETAPGTAGVDWHRAFRDVETRLREWTAQLACGAVHEQSRRKDFFIPASEWGTFIEEDVQRRSRRAIEEALGD